MHACDAIISADWVITQNERREILEKAAIAIKDGYIAVVGAAGAIRREWSASEDIDLGAALIMPALINAHAHSAMTFLRGLADDQPLMQWLHNTVFPVEARLRREIVYLGALLGHAEMLATGCGACIDMYLFEDAVFEAAEKSGIRCLGGEAVFAFPSAACASPEAALARTEELAERYARHERIGVAVNPHSLYTTSEDILEKCLRLAHDRNLPLHIHLAETRAETETCLKEYGQRPVERARQLGLFSRPVIAAHLVDIDEDEAALLAQAGVIGVHNPSSNMKLASGAAPVEKAASNGLVWALGTDGPASNNQLNMFAEMRACALLAKLADNDPTARPAAAVLDMATLGGSAAMGNSMSGRIEAGAAADLTALDVARPNMQPLLNPVSQVVYAATGHECKLTMIAGEILYQNGKYKRFDYQALLQELARLADFVQRKA